MKSSARNIKLSSVDDLFSTEETRQEGQNGMNREKVRMIPLDELHSFEGHPFKVERNQELFELRNSIEKEGVIVPLLVRKNPYGDGYEIIAGHRRKEAALWAGFMEVPVIIRELDDDQSVIAMVDSVRP